jgi:hypothetical protein
MGLFDFVRDFQVYRKTKNEPESKVKTPGPAWKGIEIQQADSGDLTKSDLGETFAKEAFIQKGCWKKNKDLIGSGWHIVHKDPEKEPDEIDIKIIEDFNQKTNIKDKLILSGVSADVYGDGFIEKIYSESKDSTCEDNVQNDQGESIYPLVDLKILDGEFISNFEKKKYSRNEQKYYILKTKGDTLYFHPSRLIHVAERRYPGKIFGISRLYIGRNIINSKIIADRDFGTFIEWAGSGVFDNTVTGANENIIKELALRYKSRKKIFMHDENETWQVLNPTIFNPEPFAQFFYINIAALFDMPWYVLAGVSPGQLTGSEIGMADYTKTLSNLRETVYSYYLTTIYTELLRGQGRSFDEYQVEWNPDYVDETSEATILKLRSDAAAVLYNINSIDEEEVRLIAQNGIVDKDGNSVLKKELPTIDNQPSIVIQPGSIPEEPIVPPPKKEEGWMTADEKLQYEKEKLIGEIELIKQDERLKNASKNKNKKN